MNAATQTVFTIIVDNFPEVTNPLSDYTTSAGSHFEFAVPDNTFTDRDNDVLRYSAMLSYGAPLPTWLTFDVDSMRFSGNPQDTDVGAIDVRLYVIDSYGGSISDDFRIGVESRITAMLADLGTALKYFGIATASYGFYKNRALFWNRLGGIGLIKRQKWLLLMNRIRVNLALPNLIFIVYRLKYQEIICPLHSVDVFLWTLAAA